MTISRHKYKIYWQPAKLWQRLNINQLQKKTLLENNSLTKKFKQQCPKLTVKILSEKWERPLPYEAKQLGIKNSNYAWIRCVVLQCEQQNILYARTVIPNFTHKNSWFSIKKLGIKPLGEVLFNLKTVKRSAFKITKQNIQWPYLVNNDTTPARYSIFEQKNNYLLLTEVFLS